MNMTTRKEKSYKTATYEVSIREAIQWSNGTTYYDFPKRARRPVFGWTRESATLADVWKNLNNLLLSAEVSGLDCILTPCIKRDLKARHLRNGAMHKIGEAGTRYPLGIYIRRRELTFYRAVSA